MNHRQQQRTGVSIGWTAGLVLALVVATSACSSSSSPTAPSLQLQAEIPQTTAVTTPPAASGTGVRAATLQSANGYSTGGAATIVLDGSQFRLELDDGFHTAASGTLEVRLCVDEGCSGSFLQVGRIQRFRGPQAYSLPNDGAAYGYVVIWCRGTNLAFGLGALR